jgi:hypothetical protein
VIIDPSHPEFNSNELICQQTQVQSCVHGISEGPYVGQFAIQGPG